MTVSGNLGPVLAGRRAIASVDRLGRIDVRIEAPLGAARTQPVEVGIGGGVEPEGEDEGRDLNIGPRGDLPLVTYRTESGPGCDAADQLVEGVPAGGGGVTEEDGVEPCGEALELTGTGGKGLTLNPDDVAPSVEVGCRSGGLERQG